MITRYVDYLDQLVMYVPSCPNAIILNALKRSGRKFCEDTEAWRTDLLIDTVSGESDYELGIPSQTEMKRVLKDGIKLRGTILCPSQFNIGVSELRADEQAPSGSLFVVSGEGLCDDASPIGYYKLTDNQEAFQVYEGVNVNFRIMVDQLAVSVALNKTGAAELHGWKLADTTNPIGDYTEVNGEGAISIGAVSGTQIPNPILELLTPARETESEGLKASVVLVPEYKSDGLPIDFLNRYGDGIMGGALDILMRMPNSPWANAQSAGDFKKDYFANQSRARKDNLTGRRY